jgi:hypothetical protein
MRDHRASLGSAAVALTLAWSGGAVFPFPAGATVFPTLSPASTSVACTIVNPPSPPLEVPRSLAEAGQNIACSAPVAGASVKALLGPESPSVSVFSGANIGASELVSTEADGTVNWQVLLAFKAPPPRPVEVPVNAHVHLETKFLEWDPANFGSATALASVTFILNGFAEPFLAVQHKGFGADDSDRFESFDRKFSLRTTDLLGVSSQAACQGAISTDRFSAGHFLCHAFSDPVFTLDQAAFDAESAALGLPTFSLNDFFTLVYSPNLELTTAIPEPPAAFSLLAGLLALLAPAGVKRRSMRSGSSKWRRPRKAVACRPHCRIAPGSAIPIGQ